MENVTLHFAWAAPLTADIDAAASHISISSLSLHPPRHAGASPIALLWDSLKKASSRGVIIDFYLPQVARSHPATALNQNAAATLHGIGVRVAFAPPANLLHAKTVAVDESILWCGSGNWTAAATAHNHESYLRVVCPSIAREMVNHWRGLAKGWAS